MRTRRGISFRGRRRIDLELLHGQAVVDVAFTELFDLETEESRASLHWEDVAVTADGFSDGSSIDGRFYGPITKRRAGCSSEATSSAHSARPRRRSRE